MTPHITFMTPHITNTCPDNPASPGYIYMFAPELIPMKKLPDTIYLLAVLILTALWQPALAQPAKSKDALKEDAETEQHLRQHIAVLANDSLEGRRAGTPGEQKAVNYIVHQYQTTGIPAVASSYIQEFDIDEGKMLTPESKVLLNDKPMALDKDFFPLAWSKEGDIHDASSLSLHEQGAGWWIDLKDILESNANNPHFIADQFLQEKVNEAAAKGATAVFLYNSGSHADSLKFNRKDKVAPVKLPVIYFTKDALNNAGVDISSAPAVDASIRFMEKHRKAHNVIAFLDNGAPQTVIIGAHLDHLGYGEDENSRYTGPKAIHNGADDNASGTAAVMEIARIIKAKTIDAKKKKQVAELKKFNYVFVHFSGEELGLFGSKYFVDHPAVDLQKVDYMINLDMVGRLNDSSTLTLGGYGTSPQWPALLPQATNYGLQIKIDSSGSGPSDHTSFYRKDIPVLFFFTGLHSDYHKPDDDADKINYAGETAIIDYIIDLLGKTGTAGKLSFSKTREQTMGTTRFKVSVGIMPDYAFSGEGVKADGVIDGRPAQKAGMQTGDVIIKLGEFPVTGMESYMQALNKFEKGQTTTVTIKRGTEEKQLQLTF